MVALPYSVIYYTYISGTLGLCFNNLCSIYWCSVCGICKRSDTLWPAGCVRLFADYTISLSSLCRLIWRYWTTNMLVKCVSKIETILAIIFLSIYGAVCLQLTLSWLWKCVLYLIIIIKSEVWIVNHCLGLGHETMVCAVCLNMFLRLL